MIQQAVYRAQLWLCRRKCEVCVLVKQSSDTFSYKTKVPNGGFGSDAVERFFFPFSAMEKFYG